MSGGVSSQKSFSWKVIIHDYEDVFVNLVEVKKENWSFGIGIAQYVEQWNLNDGLNNYRTLSPRLQVTFYFDI